MGEITDALRVHLRELAQSDARLLRELDAAIPGGAGAQVSLSGTDSVAQLHDGLERLSLKDLKELCKQRRIKGITKLKKDELVALLRGGSTAPPAALPTGDRASSTSTSAPALAPAAAPQLETRLERMEGLLQRIAAHLGVS